MIVAVPADTPVTTPVDDPTVATAVAADDQVPPLVVLVHVWDEPIHIGVIPEIVWVIGLPIVTEVYPCVPHPQAGAYALK